MIKVNLLDSVTDRARAAAVVEAKVADPRMRLLMLGLAVFALLGLAMVFDFVSARTAASRAQAELEKEKEVAAKMAAINKEQAELEKKIKDIQTRIEAIKVLRASQRGPVSLLSAVNERLPAVPEFRLETVEQKGGDLTIEGHSPNEAAVTQFARSLEFSSELFQNVGIETERKQVEVNKEDYADGKGEVDPDYKPETVRFKIKCKYGPAQPPPGQAEPAKDAKDAKDSKDAAKKEVASR